MDNNQQNNQTLVQPALKTVKDNHIVRPWVGVSLVIAAALLAFFAFYFDIQNNVIFQGRIFTNAAPGRSCFICRPQQSKSTKSPSTQDLNSVPPVSANQPADQQSAIGTQANSNSGITVISPQSGATVVSPLRIMGFGLPAFEGVPGFVQIFDANGMLLVQQPLTVADFGAGKPDGFAVTVKFAKPTAGKGLVNLTLRVHNDNPSGLAENAKFIDVPLKINLGN